MDPNFEIIYNFLVMRDLKPPKSDLIIGFGHFDLRIPQKCAQLYQENSASKILFTGGVGAGSAGFEQPEAVEFKNHISKTVPTEHILLETKSTNTAQNIEFSLEVLAKNWPAVDLKIPEVKIIAVATPARQRRVHQTLLKFFPAALIYNQPPESDLKTDQQLFKKNGDQIERTILGEMERLIDYPSKGWISPVEIPEDVMQTYRKLKNSKKW